MTVSFIGTNNDYINMAFEIAGRHHLSHFCVSSVLWIWRKQGILPNLEATQILRIKNFDWNSYVPVFELSDYRQDKIS